MHTPSDDEDIENRTQGAYPQEPAQSREPVQKAFSHTPTYHACDCHQQQKQEDLLSLVCKVNTAQSSTVRISPMLDAVDALEARETEAFHCVKTVDDFPAMKMDELQLWAAILSQKQC